MDLWYWKRLLYQLSHNHFFDKISIPHRLICFILATSNLLFNFKLKDLERLSTNIHSAGVDGEIIISDYFSSIGLRKFKFVKLSSRSEHWTILTFVKEVWVLPMT